MRKDEHCRKKKGRVQKMVKINMRRISATCDMLAILLDDESTFLYVYEGVSKQILFMYLIYRLY